MASSTMRLSGLISGMDTESIIQQLVSAKQTKVDDAKKAQTKLEWKTTAWKDLNTKLKNLQSKYVNNMRFTSAYMKKTTSVSDSTAASIITGENAMNGVQNLKAKGYGIGKSLFDAEKVDYCKDMMKKAEEKGVKLLLPVDTVISANFPDPIDAPIDVKTVSVDAIPADMEGMDIGEKTRELFADAVKNAKTVVWNGPMGVFENPRP